MKGLPMQCITEPPSPLETIRSQYLKEDYKLLANRAVQYLSDLYCTQEKVDEETLVDLLDALLQLSARDNHNFETI
jgi:hypothetical protein